MINPSQPNLSVRPLHQQLFVPIAIVALVAFSVIGIVGAWIVRVGTTGNVSRIQEVALNEASGKVINELDSAFIGVRQIAVDSPVQLFGIEATSLSSSQGELQRTQQALIAQMTALLESGNSNYTSVRYILRTGSVWTEVTRTPDGSLSVDSDFYLRQRDPGTEATLSNALRTEVGTVIISAIELRRNEAGEPLNPVQPYISLFSPVTRPNDPNSVLGVLQLEMDVTALLNHVNRAATDSISGAEGRRFLLVNSRNQILADSNSIDRNYLIGYAVNDSTAANHDPADNALFGLLANNFAQLDTVSQGNNILSTRSVSLGESPDMPWRVVIVDNALILYRNSNIAAGLVLGISLLIGVSVVVAGSFFIRRRLRAVDVTSSVIENLDGGQLSAAEQMPAALDTSRNDLQDIQMLNRARGLAKQLQGLNQRIDDQAQEYTRNLRIAARISRETATLEDIDELVNRAINLIANSFRLYHAQVFLVDDAKINAQLVYSRGDAGRQMLARKHRLPIGGDSIIGRVTATGRPVIVNDTGNIGAGEAHRFNPILPDTRSEMALPLQIGDDIIGALDLQSAEANRFSERDIETFQLLADQLAIAMYKTRLLRQSDARVRQIEMLNRQLTQTAWEELEREVGLERAYRYNLMDVEAGDLDASITETRRMISVPIAIRGEVIGTINAAPPENGEFTKGDFSVLNSVAQRVALAVENARLFQETQTTLIETETLYQTSRYLNEAETMEGIIEAIILSALPGANAGQVAVYAENIEPDSPHAALEILASWVDPQSSQVMVNPAFQPVLLNGLQLRVDEHPLLANISEVLLVQDTQHDKRLDDEFRNLFAQLNARSVVFLPLNVRGKRRGSILIEFPTVREFSERDGRIYNNLIDQAGVAIDNRLLLRQTENALSQNERLYAGSRMINQAQGLDDLVRAAVITNNTPDMNFGLAVFEGQLDDTHWPANLRHVAQSRSGGIYEPQRLYSIAVNVDSPLRRREPVNMTYSADQEAAGQMPPLMPIVRANGDRYATVFPLFASNLPTALFFVTRKEATTISDEDYEIYRALTGQMSTVIQNRRLLEQTAVALDETRRLYEASRAITNAQDTEGVYKAAAVHLAEASPRVNRLNLLLAGPESAINAPYLDCVFSWVRSERTEYELPRGLRLNQDEHPFGSILQAAGGVLSIGDVYNELNNQPEIRRLFIESNIRSVVIAAVQTRQNWLGVITVESGDRNTFDEQYVRYVQALADQIAIAIENQQLFQQAQQEAQQALALAEAGQLANQMGGDLAESLNSLFVRVAETAGYNRWLLALLSEDQTRLEVVVQRVPNFDQPILAESVAFSEIDHPIADAIRFNRLLPVNDPVNYPSFADAPAAIQASGKHIAIPVTTGDQIIGALLVGRDLNQPDLTDRDETLVTTLAAQVAVTIENRRLFLRAENERNTLRSILNTLPAGVLVLDAETLKPVEHNAQMREFLGHDIDTETPFNTASYQIYRTGTSLFYPDEELPIFFSQRTGESGFSDDVSLITEDGTQIDMLINSAPIRNPRGRVISIVVAFEDISALRSLENTLQDNLRETVSLYEATRALSGADELNEVLDVILFQLGMMLPDNAYVLLLDESGVRKEVARSLGIPLVIADIPNHILDATESLFVSQVSGTSGASILSERERELLEANNIAAFASIPLKATKAQQRGALGWIFVTYSAPHDFSPEQERFLTTLSDNAAVAIDNRYLFQSTGRALSETTAIYSATTTISRARNLNDLAGVIRVSLESLTPDVYAGYLMTDPSAPELVTTLFNLSMDSGQLHFDTLLHKYGLFRDERLFYSDLAMTDNPSAFQTELLERYHLRGFASVSVRVKGMPNGRLFIGYNRPHHFTDGDQRFLQAIADSASIVVDNIILVDQTRTSLEETSILYKASRMLADATSAEQVMQVVITELIGSYVTQVFLGLLTSARWTSDNASLQVVGSWQRNNSGVNLSGISLTQDQFPAWSLLSTPSVVTIDDLFEQGSLTEIELEGISSLDARSIAIIPLRVPNRSIGVVWIASSELHRFDEREKRIFQAFAEQASLSMEASYLLEQTERRARQLSISAEVSQIASSILDIDLLMPHVADLIKDSFGYDHVQIFLMDAADEYAELRASTGEPGQQLLGIKHKLAKGSASVIGQVTEQGKPIIALDTSDAAVVHRPNPYLPLTRSEMALPIIIKGEVIGALDVQSNQPNIFNQDDVSVLTTLASQLAVAIDNARLFDQAKVRADEMGFLFAVTTAGASAAGLQEALDNVIELIAGPVLRSNTVAIYLLNQAVEQDERVLKIVALKGSDQPLNEVEEVYLGDPRRRLGQVALDLIPAIIDNINDEVDYLALLPDARSAIIVPLSTSSAVLGLMVLESVRPAFYSQDTLTLLLSLATTLSATIQNALLISDIQQKNEELTTLDRLKSDFLANMSHELRTPLNSIIGFSRVMLKRIDGPLTEMQEQDLSTIYTSGQHLLGLINDILDSAKIAADKMDLQKDFFDVVNLVQGVRAIGTGLVKEKPVEIYANIANNLPQAFGDEFRSRQVLLNLVSNAAKFTSEGSVTLSVYVVEDEVRGAMIRLDVTDTGIGIDQKDISILFEAFRQVDNSLTRTAEGTGLGLPIAKSLVELQGGNMFVQSQLGVGSTFSFTIPTQPIVVDLETEAPALVIEPPQAADTGAPVIKTMLSTAGGPPPGVFTQKRQALLIEDNPTHVDQFRKLLQREGFEVHTAPDPFFADTMAGGLRPTLIVIDVDFANNQGWDVLQRIKDRDDTFDIPVIVVSENTDTERMYQMGAYATFARPYEPDTFVETVLEAEKDSNIDRVLIIDDQPDSTRLIEQVLLEHGKYRVFAAHTGAEGISLVARRRPDLIVLDLRMPEMDGFKVLEELRARPETAQIPVVVVTSETTLSEDERGRLTNLRILYKTDLNQANYHIFIDEVRKHISSYHGD